MSLVKSLTNFASKFRPERVTKEPNAKRAQKKEREQLLDSFQAVEQSLLTNGQPVNGFDGRLRLDPSARQRLASGGMKSAQTVAGELTAGIPLFDEVVGELNGKGELKNLHAVKRDSGSIQEVWTTSVSALGEETRHVRRHGDESYGVEKLHTTKNGTIYQDAEVDYGSKDPTDDKQARFPVLVFPTTPYGGIGGLRQATADEIVDEGLSTMPPPPKMPQISSDHSFSIPGLVNFSGPSSTASAAVGLGTSHPLAPITNPGIGSSNLSGPQGLGAPGELGSIGAVRGTSFAISGGIDSSHLTASFLD